MFVFLLNESEVKKSSRSTTNKTVGNGLLEMSSTSSPSYRCEACGRSFNWPQELEEHKLKEHRK
jgi:hypothetical protein